MATRRLVGRLAEHERGFKRKTVRTVVGLMIIYLVYLFCAGDFGLFRIYRLHRQRATLDGEYRDIVAGAVDYSYRLRRLRTDPHYFEWLARTRYGFSRPTEKIYRVTIPPRFNGHP